ncbi:MAG: zf-HC2 domain-containing protein [Clostridia bacterium]
MTVVCRENLERISLMADDLLEQEERNNLENHLEGCPACRKYHRELVTVKSALPALSHDLPFDLSEEVVRRLKKESAAKRTMKRISIMIPSMAAACLVLAVSIILFNRSNLMTKGNMDSLMSDAEKRNSEDNSFTIAGMAPSPDPAPAWESSVLEYEMGHEKLLLKDFMKAFKDEYPDLSITEEGNALVFDADQETMDSIIERFNLVLIQSSSDELRTSSQTYTRRIVFNE